MTTLDAHMDAIAKLASGKAGPEILAPLMEDKSDPGPRALVYRNSGLSALRDALASNFPSLRTIMDADFFNKMARTYADAHPPRGRSLVGYGVHLPGFITKAKDAHGLPWLADLARLDIAWLNAHLAAGVDEMTGEDFAQLAADPDALMVTHLAFQPSIQMTETGWPLHDLWTGLRAGTAVDTSMELKEVVETTLIWRLDNEVRTRVLAAPEAIFLAALSDGQALGKAAEAAITHDENLDISGLLAASVSAGLFTK